MINLKEAFGLRLKKLRKNRKLTQEEFAELLGVNTRQLNRIEAGENFPSADTLAKISCALDIELSYLFNFLWNKKFTIITTSTDDNPVIRLIEKDKFVYFAQQSEKTVNSLSKSQKINLSESETIMLSVAAKLNKPITVECFRDKKRRYVKTYHPGGKSEVIMNEKKIESETIQNFVKRKLDEYEMELQKLEFIRLAVAAIEDDNAFNELKTFLRGMEFECMRPKSRQ